MPRAVLGPARTKIRSADPIEVDFDWGTQGASSKISQADEPSAATAIAADTKAEPSEKTLGPLGPPPTGHPDELVHDPDLDALIHPDADPAIRAAIALFAGVQVPVEHPAPAPGTVITRWSEAAEFGRLRCKHYGGPFIWGAVGTIQDRHTPEGRRPGNGDRKYIMLDPDYVPHVCGRSARVVTVEGTDSEPQATEPAAVWNEHGGRTERGSEAGSNEVRTTSTKLNRTTFRTSRRMDFCSRKELIAQTGHEPEAWPLVILKERVDNALDACEEARIAPEVTVTVDESGIAVTDNGPEIPADTVEGVIDFSVRVSRREAYLAPDRGAQGNALQTLVAIPFVLDGECGEVDIAAQGTHHRIRLRVDRIRQEPMIDHDRQADQNVKTGTCVRRDNSNGLRVSESYRRDLSYTP